MMGSMGEEIAAAAAARANRRRRQQQQQQLSTSQVSTGTFSNESIEIAATTATPTNNDGNILTAQSSTNPAAAAAAAAAAAFLKQRQPSRRPRGVDDPPGWDSKWAPNSIERMEKQVAQKSLGRGTTTYSASVNTLYRRPYTASVPPGDDDDSFHAPMSSWVPQLRDKGDSAVSKTDATTTRWQSAATKKALDTAVPRKSWKPKRKRKPLDNHPLLDESYNDYSWAPHLHPLGPHALHPYPPGTSGGRCDDSVDRGDDDDDDGNGTAADENNSQDNSNIIVEEDGSAASSNGHISDATSDMVEIVEDGESGNETNSRQSLNHEDDNDSERTEAIFARTSQASASVHSSNNRKRNTSNDDDADHNSQGSTKQSAASDDHNIMERGGCDDGQSDYTTFLVDAEDTFQVFDSNWNFAPSMGTLCVLGLMIVLALEGVAVGLYFALR